MKKHVIIVDDQLRVESERLFSKFDIDAEVVLVQNVREAKARLKQWAKQGLKADLVSFDSMGIGQHGAEAARDVVNWGKGSGMTPAQIVLHTGVLSSHESHPETKKLKREGIFVADRREWEAIAAHKRNISRAVDESETTTLRKYLNEIWHTNFALDKARENFLIKTSMGQDGVALPPAELQRAIEDGLVKSEEAISHLDIARFRDLFTDTLDPDDYERFMDDTHPDEHYPIELQFARGDNRITTGNLAFTESDIDTLHRRGLKAILCLGKIDPSQDYLLDKVDGLIILEGEDAHIRPLAESHRVPVLSELVPDDTHPEGMVCLERDKNGDRYLYTMYDNLKTGSPVTLDKKRLLNAHVEIKNNYDNALDDSKNALLAQADRILLAEGRARVLLNADTADTAVQEIKLGATGIGLLRTEHMVKESGRATSLRKALLADKDSNEYHEALDFLKQEYFADFKRIYETANDYDPHMPIRIRLLDALPSEIFVSNIKAEASMTYMAEALNLDARTTIERITEMVSNDVRGARQADRNPDLFRIQCEAVFEAANEADYNGIPEIMVPLVESGGQLGRMKAVVEKAKHESSYDKAYKFGSMVETKSVLESMHGIARQADFISLGTNDLTQEITGLNRAGNRHEIDNWLRTQDPTSDNPFFSLHHTVLREINKALKMAKAARPDLQIEACGVHAADEESIIELYRAGVTDFSVAPKGINIATAKATLAKEIFNEKPELAARAASEVAPNSPGRDNAFTNA